MSSPTVACPSCGHKSRIRQEAYGKSVRCLYCMESFVVTPGIVFPPKTLNRDQLVTTVSLLFVIITVSSCVYLWRQNAELVRRLDQVDAQHRELEEKIRSLKERYYLVTFDYTDHTGK